MGKKDHSDPCAEPTSLVLSTEAEAILQARRLLDFLRKFGAQDEAVARQFLSSWQDGQVLVGGISYHVSLSFMARLINLPYEGEVIRRENHSLKLELIKFEGVELSQKYTKEVPRNAIRGPWGEVVAVIMSFLTVDKEVKLIQSFHFAFLNHIRGNRMNVLAFMFAELERAVANYKKGEKLIMPA